jgi:hypothetical protein
MVTVALFAGTLAVAIHEYGLGLGDRAILVHCSPSPRPFAVSIALWVASPAYPQLFAIAGATLFVGVAVANWPDEFSQELLGMTILSIALAALALAEVGWLTPVLGARFLFSALAIFGPFAASMDDGPVAFEVLAGAMAAAVIAYGVFRASFALVLVGVVGAFAVLVFFITRHFSDRIGADGDDRGGILIAGSSSSRSTAVNFRTGRAREDAPLRGRRPWRIGPARRRRRRRFRLRPPQPLAAVAPGGPSPGDPRGDPLR